MDEERLSRMMADPNVQQSMTEALNNPDFVNMLIESNPMLRNMPNAREIITSPFMRQMMGNPQMLSQAMRMQRNMRGGDGAFPAPGATDTTPEGAQAAGTEGQGGANSGQPNPMNPFMNPFMGGGAGAGGGGGAGGAGGMSIADLMQSMGGAGFNPFGAPQQGAGGQTQTGPDAAAGNTSTGNQGSTENRDDAATQGNNQGAGSQQNAQGQAAANPFAALFPGAGGAGGAGGAQGNPFGISPEQMMQMMQMFGGGGAGSGAGGSPAAPPDNRPPEERYAEQLRQLNDMGFFDFDRNVAALRRSGGSVQGAIEHLLGAMD
jgi:ubiquilin